MLLSWQSRQGPARSGLFMTNYLGKLASVMWHMCWPRQLDVAAFDGKSIKHH